MLFFAAGLAAVVAAVWCCLKSGFTAMPTSGVECAEENSPSIVRNGKAAFARLIIPPG